ncbi:MAG TPA: uracil-DNA glycosylase [Candidatus Tumulicola sp.]|nr:uracil-DNA glycosylase [Candidatus Tumulicola sp.]
MRSLVEIRRRETRCTRCPELRRYCADIARTRKREFASERYWGRPVPSSGSADARVLLVGLAPAAHGGNRTGRMFTGDGSATWLARALHKAGFATQSTSERRDDGFELLDVFMTAALRCAPPKNKPTPRQIANCAGHMRAELALLRRLRVVVGLGKIGFDVALARLKERGFAIPSPKPRFGHGAEYELASSDETITLVGCFHPSRQNTNTGKLTAAMLDAVFLRVRQIARARNPR